MGEINNFLEVDLGCKCFKVEEAPSKVAHKIGDKIELLRKREKEGNTRGALVDVVKVLGMMDKVLHNARQCRAPLGRK